MLRRPDSKLALRFVGLILLIAAFLKAFELAYAASGSVILNPTFWLTECELLIALFFISGQKHRLAWRFAVILLVGFAIFNISKVIRGDEFCGCFGIWKPSPWVTLAIDLGMISLISCFPPTASSLGTERVTRSMLACSLALCLCLGVTANLRMVSDDGIYDVKIEAQPGQFLELIQYTDIESDLTKGEWSIVLYRERCPHCQDLPTQLEAFYDQNPNARVAVVKVAPAEKNIEWGSPNKFVTFGNLSQDRYWIVETPLIFKTIDGVLKDSSTSL